MNDKVVSILRETISMLEAHANEIENAALYPYELDVSIHIGGAYNFSSEIHYVENE